MHDITDVEIDLVKAHLKASGTGVGLNLEDMPKPLTGYKAFRGYLDGADLERVFLWFEYKKETHNESRRLVDALPSAAEKPRIKSFIEGDAKRGFKSVDLRRASRFELVLLSDDIERGFLYAIDGNNRILAQHLSGKRIQDVPTFICQHPSMLDWGYVPSVVRDWHRTKT